MPSVIDYGCANCGAELDPAKTVERRAVPRRGGRRLPVCEDCVKEIDAQGTLDAELGERPERAASAGGIALLDLGVMYPANRCVYCRASDRQEKMKAVVMKSAMARAVRCENQRRCIRRQRARREAA